MKCPKCGEELRQRELVQGSIREIDGVIVVKVSGSY